MKKIISYHQLYNRRSLADFLDYKENCPDEPVVYVLQEPPENINIIGAADYGSLAVCLPQESQVGFSSVGFIKKMKKNLTDFTENDYILCTGDPAIIGMSCAIASDYTNGCFNLLKWDRRAQKYFPIRIDLENGDIDGNR